MKKRKSKALAKRTEHPVAKRHAPRPMDTLALAATAQGKRVATARSYFQPVVDNRHVLWNAVKNEKGEIIDWKPYSTLPAVEDNVQRRGVKSIIVDHLEPVTCKAAGCYGGSESTVQYRAKCTITLESGQVFSDEGDACPHNVTKMIWGVVGVKKNNSTRRMAASRAIARAGTLAANMKMACIVEVPYLIGEVKVGKRVMTQQEVADVMSGGEAHEEERKEIEHQPREESLDKRSPRERVNAALHGQAGDMGLNTEGLHRWIHKRENVESLKALAVDRLQHYVDWLKKMDAGKAGRLKDLCVQLAKETANAEPSRAA